MEEGSHVNHLLISLHVGAAGPVSKRGEKEKGSVGDGYVYLGAPATTTTINTRLLGTTTSTTPSTVHCSTSIIASLQLLLIVLLLLLPLLLLYMHSTLIVDRSLYEHDKISLTILIKSKLHKRAKFITPPQSAGRSFRIQRI